MVEHLRLKLAPPETGAKCYKSRRRTVSAWLGKQRLRVQWLIGTSLGIHQHILSKLEDNYILNPLQMKTVV